MVLPDNIRLSEKELFVRHTDGRWLPDIERITGESDEDLYYRWLNAVTDKETEQRLKDEQQRINNIISWLVPLLFLVLVYFLTAFYVDSN